MILLAYGRKNKPGSAVLTKVVPGVIGSASWYSSVMLETSPTSSVWPPWPRGSRSSSCATTDFENTGCVTTGLPVYPRHCWPSGGLWKVLERLHMTIQKTSHKGPFTNDVS